MSELNFGRVLRRVIGTFAAQPAVQDLASGHQVTYAAHGERVASLCRAISGLGIGPGDRVAVLAGNSHAYVELWHACLAGAGIINPLNTRLAPDELRYILDDSGTGVIFVDATFAPVIADLRDQLPELREVVLIGSPSDHEGEPVPHDHHYETLLATAPSVAARHELPPEPDPVAPAVLMYTGGTTGLPMCVVLSQRAVVLAIFRMQTVVALRPPQL